MTKLFRQTISGTTAISSPWISHQAGPLSLQLVTTLTVAGAWKIEFSNKPGVVNDGDTEPSDVTSGFQTPAAVAIAAAAGVPTSQYVQTVFVKPGAYRVTFTPTSGAGEAAPYAN